MNSKMMKTDKGIGTAMIAAVFVAGCLAATPPAALAAPVSAPAFKLTGSSQTTNFVAGAEGKGAIPSEARPLYSFMATNVGSKPMSAPIVFTDTLPAGLAPVAPAARDFHVGSSFPKAEAVHIACSVSGQTVTCVDPLEDEEGHSAPLQPGQWAQFVIPVKVANDAGPVAVNEASIEGGGAGEARTEVTTAIVDSTESIPPFDFLPGSNGFSLAVSGTDGAPATLAGSHPYEVALDFGFPSIEAPGQLYGSEHLRNLKALLPRGMSANPNATPVRCTEAELNSNRHIGGGCPAAAAIGTVTVLTDLSQGPVPESSALYNMVPPPGTAAEFAFDAVNVGIYVHLMGGVNSAGEYELGADTKNILARELIPLLGIQAQLWGSPTDPSHDAMRGECAKGGSLLGCEENVERLQVPLLTMPSSCRSSLTASVSASTWENPSDLIGDSAQVEDPLGHPTGTSGCNQLGFEPSIEAKPTTNISDSPSGFGINIHLPQTDDVESLSTASIKDVKVSFPEGVTINPSAANGLGACSSSQVGFQPGAGKVRFSEDPARCPDNAKIGSVEVDTPLLDHPLPGALYVAKPFDNPFNSLLAVYLTIDDSQTGVVAKLAGRVQADHGTGQLTATFAENPELPIEDIRTKLFEGPRATLKTPLVCGSYKIAADLTPWSAPEGVDVTASDSFPTSVAASGSGPCPSSEANAPDKPAFGAGTLDPKAGAYSPFVLRLSREDGSQRFAKLETSLPKGLVGKLAGIPYCSEAQIAQAKSREAPEMGAVEQSSPSCPAASEVGTVTVGAGAGITPLYVQGHAYLAGPYKGAPLSLVIVTPAVAGPFDLGTVVVRTALYVNSESAQIHAVSDSLPSILDGIPLDLRSIALKLDRPNFTLNPTSCDPMAITGSAATLAGQSAALTSPFQVGGCSSLKFKPKLALSLKGATKRSKFPALKAVLTYPQGGPYANIASAQVTLPHSEFLEQAHIGTVCTRVQFAADACPRASIYGFARATTPLLDKPVEGPVYLRSSSHELPDLVAALSGQIDVDLVGRVDTGRGNGIRNSFEALPDAPVSRFTLEMKGGRKGLLVNSEDICRKPQKALVSYTAQDGRTLQLQPTIANSCPKKAKKRHKVRHERNKGKKHQHRGKK